MKESEIRVFYLRSQKDKHGTPKLLPCEICKTWHTRLGTHLKNIHKFSRDEITRRKNEVRSKYWKSAGRNINGITGITESDTPSVSQEKTSPNDPPNTYGGTIEYLPRNAKGLTKLQIEEFNIGKDDFQI